jgi:septal ring factor EnvC (AmiA/AmiB activator)
LIAFVLPSLPHLPHPPHLPYPPYLPQSLQAQQPERARTEAQARRVNDRIAALQREADRLAGEARTLVGDLRTLEIERDLQIERATQAQAAVTEAQAAVQQTTERLAALEQERIAQLPDLKAQLVDVYKRGRAGYARLLFGASGVREFGRATRAVAALVRINEQRVVEHRRTLEAMQQEQAALQAKLRDLQAGESRARQARAAAERALAARSALIAQIDARRDLNAQFAGELQLAAERLQRQVANLAADQPVLPVVVPIAPFRGALDWPVAGRVTGAFGQPSGRFGASTARNGIEIAAPEGTPVQAVHSGTVSYADAFAGFGTLVILDHGANNYSLYGYLGSASVTQGEAVESGAELGRVGSAPGGPPTLYFEIRIDGPSVDPVQWLRAR